MEFSVIREIIGQLNIPVNDMAALLQCPVKESLSDGTFRWIFPSCSPDVVQVAKSVRMITGIRAALQLADDGFTTECYTLLRVVSDFAAEIQFIAEGILQGEFNSSQRKFIDQYFKPFPTDPDELAKRERENYIGREDIIAAKTRLAKKAGIDSKLIKCQINYLNKGYDSYIHGAYGTAMELYSGKTHTFMLSGNESSKARHIAKVSIAGKLHDVLIALEYMSITRKLDNVSDDLRAMRIKLENSEDYNGGPLHS